MGKGPFYGPAPVAPTASALFEVSWSTDFTAETALGIDTVVANSNVTISAAQADFSTSAAHLEYGAASNWGPTLGLTDGAVRMQMRMDEVNTTRNLLETVTATPVSDQSDHFRITHGNAGFGAILWNSAGTLIINGVFDANAPVAGSTYELEVNYRLGTSASVWGYIDGVRASNTLTGSVVHGTAASVLLIGLAANLSQQSFQGTLHDFKIFGSVQHEGSSYTPE